MDILTFTALFIIGLTAIIKGADWLTDGAAAIAGRFGIPTMVVGLTVVAMGTSAPEFVVSVVSAVQGNADMALGNVIGSNIFNILVIVGITAIVKPVVVERANVRNDVPFTLLANVAVAITAFDSFFDGASHEDIISRTDGLLLLCLFAVFISYTLSIAGNGGNASMAENTCVNGADAGMQSAKPRQAPLWRSLLLVATGLVCLIVGGDWMVNGASGIATIIGISQSVIALTIVSAGTSAPELAASVMAARKGDTAMALGNVVGSCVFNVFFVLGSAAVVHPLGIGGITVFDITTLLVASVVLWLFCKFGKTYYTLTRGEGAILTAMAVAYYVIICI